MDYLQKILTPALKDYLETVAYAVAILSAIAAAIGIFVTRTLPWWRGWRNKRVLQRRLGLEAYSEQQLERALRFYIIPQCQQTDPSGHEESRGLALVQEPLFNALTRELSSRADVRHLIILADSGMGKTSAVLNYCARHLRSHRRDRFKVKLVHLGSPNANSEIDRTSEKKRTVLFLDALDEDTLAIENHHARIRHLLELASEYRCVVITCRTQFFARDEEIPRETGIIKSGPRPAGESAEYLFHKLYLSPFSDEQVIKYLRRRYPPWEREKHRRAVSILRQVPHLSARPMLLAHVDDLIRRTRPYSFAVEIYDEMVNAWIERERGFIKSPEALLEFSKRLAVDLFLNRERRGAERISTEELERLASEWNIQLKRWTLTARSLLNRDAEGSFKFAHRSIMEHLFVQRLWESSDVWPDLPWTDQMLQLFVDHANMAEILPELVDRLPLRGLVHTQLIQFLHYEITRRTSPQIPLWRMMFQLLSAWIVGEAPDAMVRMQDPRVSENRVVGVTPEGIRIWYTLPSDSPPMGQIVHVENGLGPSRSYEVLLTDPSGIAEVVKRTVDLCKVLGAKEVSVDESLEFTNVKAKYS